MMAVMSDLTAFLEARLDEAEQAAKCVRQPYRLYVSSEGRISEPKLVDNPDSERYGDYEQWADGEDRMPNHITNWSLIYDPAQVLREVEAKRQIISLHRRELELDYDPICNVCCYTPPCDTLRWLALPYSDHPDYRDEWWPGGVER